MAAVLSAVLAGAVATAASWRVQALVAGLALVLLAGTRLCFGSLLVLLIWLTSLVHLLKRAIFLLGTQSQLAYYSVLLLPSIMLLPLLFVALRETRTGVRARSARLLLAFMLWSCLVTLLPTSGLPMTARLAAVHERILPMAAFFVGLAAPLGSAVFLQAGRALVLSAGLSVGYGLLQFLTGPTLLDRVWAESSALYSLQGRNTLAFLEGAVGREGWRAFSYYADPLTWGLFLLAALAGALVMRGLDDQSQRYRWIIAWVPVVVIGLFLTLTRTPWVGLIAMVGTYWLTGWRPARRPVVISGLLAAGFAFVLMFGTFLYTQVMPLVPYSALAENPVLLRYATVGTIEARLGAWAGLKAALVGYPVLGAGFAYGDYFARALADTSVGDVGGHNFVLETAVSTGGLGLALFVGFLVALLREGLSAAEQTGFQRSARWLLAFVVGYVMTGYLNGGSYMNSYFFFLAGVLAGSAPDETPLKAKE